MRHSINTRAYVSSPREGWVSVYEERTSSQEEEEIVRLAREFSSHLQKAVVGFLVHDSDVLRYRLFDAGQPRDESSRSPTATRPLAVLPARSACRKSG